MNQQIKLTLTKSPKTKPDQNKLGFGTIFTDHMFMMDYDNQNGWHNPQILPYGPLELLPSTSVLHYAQAVFEGLKAFKSVDGRILLFRPQKNFERLNRSNERMCIPEIDSEFALEALTQLVKIDADWIPTLPGTSLYIRPFIFATENHLGVHPSPTYKFLIIMSPVASYYPNGINPIRIFVEDEYVRAVKGGTGYIKAAGNYAASIKAQAKAASKNCVQVLWLDGITKRNIEEVGAMNIMFKINGKIVTPALSGSILPGITRESCITLLKDMGIEVEERTITIDELYEQYQKGNLEEAFGTGTAAVISPVGEIVWKDQNMLVNDNKIGNISQKLYDTLTGIQYGKIKDKYGWTVEVKL